MVTPSSWSSQAENAAGAWQNFAINIPSRVGGVAQAMWGGGGWVDVLKIRLWQPSVAWNSMVYDLNNFSKMVYSYFVFTL